MKLVAYVDYNWNEFKKLSQYRKIYASSQLQNTKFWLMMLLLSCYSNICPLKFFFQLYFELNSISVNFGLSKKPFYKSFQNLFVHFFYKKNPITFFAYWYRITKFVKNAKISWIRTIIFFKWTLHNGRKNYPQRDAMDNSQFLEIKNWNWQFAWFLLSLLGYVETFKKNCFIVDECTVKIEGS